MAGPAPAKKDPPEAMDILPLENTDGGSSPWFNSKGRSLVSGLTTEAENADLFTELAREGSMGTLVNFLDTAQPTVSYVALVCYVLMGVVLLELFVLLPLAAFSLRRRMAGVGLLPWLGFEVILLGCAGVQLVCLLAMISTFSGMGNGLEQAAPDAYEWTFTLLRNYITQTVNELKATTPALAAALDKVQTAATNSVTWLRGNVTAWEDEYAGYAGLVQMVKGPLTVLQMGALGLGLAIAVSSALLACCAWNRRKKALAKGGRSPVFVGLVVMTGAVMLFGHALVALPMIARWLPVCVMADTYLCAPYRDHRFSVIDDGVTKIWPQANRPDPFCRLVPSKVYEKCTVQGKTGIEALAPCPAAEGPNQRTLSIPGNAKLGLQPALQPPVRRPPAAAVTSPGKKPDGDCFYPYKVIDIDMTSVCPLFTDDLLAHWMAVVMATTFGLISSVAALAIATIFLAIGEKKGKKSKRRVRKRRVTRTRKKNNKKASTPFSSPSTPPPEPPPPPPPEPQHLVVEVPLPVPVPVPVHSPPPQPTFMQSSMPLPQEMMTPRHDLMPIRTMSSATVIPSANLYDTSDGMIYSQSPRVAIVTPRTVYSRRVFSPAIQSHSPIHVGTPPA